jgi:hypothetical protein
MLENVAELGPELWREPRSDLATLVTVKSQLWISRVEEDISVCDVVQIRAAGHNLARIVLRLMTSRQTLWRQKGSSGTVVHRASLVLVGGAYF